MKGLAILKAEIFKKAERMVELLKFENLKIATAESCTGGMVSAYITSVPGASQIFECGIVSYSNRIKNQILNVNNVTLENIGAVSAATAEQMAENVRRISNSDIGISVTGAAGPDGQDGYAPGNVFIAISTYEKTVSNHLVIQPESRQFVREQTVLGLFEWVIAYLE